VGRGADGVLDEDPYRSWQGLPWPRVDAPAVPHRRIESMKTPLSLPPMVMVTSSVSSPSASRCGATPGYCDAVKSPVSAAP
jgi:hypothetical protein